MAIMSASKVSLFIARLRNFVAVGINGVHTIVQNLGHPGGIVDAQTHKRQYPQIGIQEFPLQPALSARLDAATR